MCGLAGFLTSRALPEPELRERLRRMIAPLAHRGPDDEGEWLDSDAGIGIGFRRLAILDLSAHGHQPMTSPTGRFVIVLNGEIFNHRALRADLEDAGTRFRGHSDTEVVAAAFERWGIERATLRMAGMFAIAAWDRRERTLTLVRDRLGIKPLFVYAKDGFVSFGSELKALAADPAFDRTLDRDALVDYLRYLYVPAPHTIYRHARKLLPGHLLTIGDAAAPLPESHPYWSLEDAATRGLASPFAGDEREAIDEVERVLRDVVREHRESDVPLGAMLSGGVDSSLVTALMQEQESKPLRTFAVGFDAGEHDESHHAALVARHLGTEHTEVRLTGDDALAVVPRLPELFDEPHADAAQLPAFLVCAAARRHVTVALTGDGGDEVFGGYNRYTYGDDVLRRVLRVPRPARRLMAAGIGSLSAGAWGRAHGALAPILPPSFRQRLAGEKISKVGRLLRGDSFAQMYRSMLSAWQEPHSLVRGGTARDGVLERVLDADAPADTIDRMMLADQLTSLADDHLAKVDRVSMAVGLEARVPLLDHRLVELSWRLPRSLKLRPGRGKIALRALLERRMPRELIERPKVGFTVPLERWLRGPLRSWAEEMLIGSRLDDDGVLRAAPVRAAWTGLLSGRSELALPLWTVLVYRAWRERWRP